MSDEKYFNFPIQLLEDFLTDTNKALDNIYYYSFYVQANSYESREGFEWIGNYDIEKTFELTDSFFRIRTGKRKKSFKNGEILYNSIPEKSPKVGLKVKIWFDFYKNEKSEFDKACLLGFLAIKSILQNKPYCKIDNKFWLARMDGKPSSVKCLSELSEDILKFSNEYQTVKIKNELKYNWNLKTYSRYTRGFYVSFKLEFEQLVFEAEKRRKSTKEKQFKKREQEARLNALEKLNENIR